MAYDLPCHHTLTSDGQVDVCMECCSPDLMGAFVNRLRTRALASEGIDGSVGVSRPSNGGMVPK